MLKVHVWDLNNVLGASVKPGLTTSDTNLVSTCLVAFCCQLSRSWLGSGSSTPGGGKVPARPGGHCQPGFFHPFSQPPHIDSAMKGYLFLTMLLTLCAVCFFVITLWDASRMAPESMWVVAEVSSWTTSTVRVWPGNHSRPETEQDPQFGGSTRGCGDRILARSRSWMQLCDVRMRR